MTVGAAAVAGVRTDSRRSAVVVGAGVTGLTTAVCLAESGWHVQVWAAEVGRQTTSAVAAAVWDPYKADPPARVLDWAKRSLHAFGRLSGAPAAGIRWREAVRLVPASQVLPWWLAAVPRWREATDDELPAGYERAFVFTIPVIEMPRYLGWLLGRLDDNGVAVQRRRLDALDAALEASDVVFDCAGLGARELAADDDLRPVRGQVVRVRNPDLTRVVVDEFHPEDVTYIVPRSGDCVLGGTTDEDSWDLRPDPATAERIIDRCTAIEPRLRGAEITGHAVGLRPVRSSVRVEREDRGDKAVVHNYGHGGAGVTLSWGCARDAVALADARVPR